MAQEKFKLQGHLSVQGLPIAVENKPGSVRKGVGKDGKPWRTEMKHHYGYIQGTKGADGEEVDAYVGPHRGAKDAFVVHQHKEDGRGFDEDKVMLGFKSKKDAEKAFLAHYDDPKFLGPVSKVPMEKLKDKVESGETLKKISASHTKGYYKGQPSDPDTVKKKTEYMGIPIHIDRPKGFIMMGTDKDGNDWSRRYKYDYGYIPDTLGGDGDGVDVFLGPEKNAHDAYWAVQKKPDGSFDEYKVFLGFANRESAMAAYRDHIPKKLLNGIVTMKVEMMKAMLGKVEPEHQIKKASMLSFVDELSFLLRTSCT